MKFYAIVLSVFLMVLSTACNKNDEQNDNIVGSGEITVTIGGKKSVFKEVNGTGLGDKIVIGAALSDLDIEMILDSDISKGTYTNDKYAITCGNGEGEGIFTTVTNVTSKSLTITDHDKAHNHIKGTFKLVYTDHETQASVKVEGSFDVKYTAL
jgi:hypothetical protein